MRRFVGLVCFVAVVSWACAEGSDIVGLSFL